MVKDDSGNVIQCGFGVPTSGRKILINTWKYSLFRMAWAILWMRQVMKLFNKPEAVEAMDFLRQLKDAGLVD